MNQIANGTKLQVAFDPDAAGGLKFEMVSTYKETLDESSFLMAIPMKDGRPVEIDENTKLILQYAMGSETLVIAAYKDDVVKQGVRRYWKMRRVTEQRQFFQRADERYKTALHCEFWQETWPLKDGKIEHEEALTLDISAGGVAAYMALRFEVGEMVKFLLPRVGTDPAGAAQETVAAVCWTREAPKGSPYRLVTGLQFKYAGEEDKEVVRQYIENLRKVYNL